MLSENISTEIGAIAVRGYLMKSDAVIWGPGQLPDEVRVVVRVAGGGGGLLRPLFVDEFDSPIHYINVWESWKQSIW